MASKEGKVVIVENGPYLISGLPLAREIIVPGKDGIPEKWSPGPKCPDRENYSLCRCGKSDCKPYCDGSHMNGFDGKETASKKKYLERAERIKGPGMTLTDVPDLCAAAGFCHRGGSVWDLTMRSSDPKAKKTAIDDSCDCPSGRLVAWDGGKPIEPKFKPSISLVEDPQKCVSGPIWVKGNVPIQSSDGSLYEVRNRVTLCRCGQSKNKPFCDGTHISARFRGTLNED